MNKILSLIANPKTPVLDDAVLARFQRQFPAAEIRELKKAVAYEIALEPAEDILARAGEARQDAPIDVNLLDSENRRKRLLIADMDSTMIEQECIDELADFAGKRAEISDITERAMRGELDFEAALKERVAMLKGLSESVLAEAFEHRITLTSGARALITTMNAQGARTALVSGGFTYFTGRVATACGFHSHQANQLIIEDGVLTGAVSDPILGREAKRQALDAICAEIGIALNDAIAVGDGANDLAMLGRAGLGVAFHAKPAVAEMADARIDHGDLTALLYLQGVPEDGFTSQG